MEIIIAIVDLLLIDKSNAFKFINIPCIINI